MGDEFIREILPQPTPPAVSEPAVETPAPEPLSSKELQCIDAAFAVSKEEQAAAGLMAIWAASPLLIDRAGDHLGKKKPDQDETE